MRKVLSGEKLQIPASTYNAFVDAAQANIAQNNFLTESSKNGESRKVIVQNNSGGNLDKFEILGIDSPLIDPDENETDFQNRITLIGVTPEDGSGGSGSDDHRGKFIVLQEPIPDGDIGRGIISGETIVKINVEDEDHKYADVTDATSTYLTSSNSGSARILWKESGTGVVWAYVRIQGKAQSEPKIYKAIADEVSGSGGNTVDVKAISIDGTLAEESDTFNVYSEGYQIRNGDLVVLTQDIDGELSVCSIQGNSDTPYELEAGTDATANEDTWDITDQPEGYQGVVVKKWSRFYWSGTAEDSAYMFTREATYDSSGRLVYVSAENKETAFATGEC